MTDKPLAVVTGASAGIGYELAACCARDGHDLAIASDDGRVDEAALSLRAMGATVDAVTADLATSEGVGRLVDLVRGRPVAALVANAGHGLGHAFLDQDWAAARHVIDTNVTGTLELIHRLGRPMRDRGAGRILLVGSIAGFTPGPYSAVYNGSKAFIDSFSFALREELKEAGVTVTCLMPGATDTEFFERAGQMDTKVGQSKKDDPAFVAQVGYDAMVAGEGDVVAGWKNKIQSALSNVTPAAMLAKSYGSASKPGSAEG